MKDGAPFETIVKVQGTVQKRDKADPKSPTGEILLEAKKIEFVSFASKDLLVAECLRRLAAEAPEDLSPRAISHAFGSPKPGTGFPQ